MNQHKAACVCRRDALKLGLSTGIGITLMAMTGHAYPQPVKLSKDAVKYTDAGNVAGKDCDDCIQYLAARSAQDPATCKIVEGPINPHGHCIAFSPKG